MLSYGTGAIHIDASRVASPGETISNHSRGSESAVSKGMYGDSAAQETHQTAGQKLGRFPTNLLLTCPTTDLDAQAGGVSRFYKQFQTEAAMGELPQDLLDYLHTMITPTVVQVEGGGQTLIALDLAAVDWAQYEDEQLHGLVARGDPTSYMEEVWRVLKPGAHVMLVAPEEQPTGHTGTIALEDRGFEIRDSLLVVNEPGKIHYVPKAPKKERNAGCAHLAERRKEHGPVYDLAEGLDDDVHSEVLEALGETDIPQDVLDNIEDVGLPRDLIPSSVRKHFKRRGKQKNSHGNHHPTVKPKAVLKRLLADVPEGAKVLDPFMGSGSMGLACMETDHISEYVGIEKETDYLAIADARVRHWDSARTGWVRATIASEAAKDKVAEEVTTLDDLFGF
jgi:hypothetical protein